MIQPIRTEDIQTYSECRANFAETLKRVRETGRPTFITNHGKTAGVLLSPEAYDELAEKALFQEHIAMLRKGIEDARAGKGIEFRAAMQQLADKFGLTMPK